jgi:DNA-binding CsgD family transcriptional regulator
VIRVDRRAFLSSPVGRFVVHGNVLVGCPVRDLRVCAVWGTPDARDAAELAVLLEVACDASMAPQVDALTDVNAMVGIDVRAFYTLVRELTKRRAMYRDRIRRQAFVRRRTLVGAVVGGLYDVVGHTFAVRTFDSYGDAAEWLGRDDVLGLEGVIAHVTADAVLTTREREVVRLLAKGRTNKEIAYDLGVTHSTVRVLLARAAAKLRTRSREQLASLAIRSLDAGVTAEEDGAS